MNIDIWKANIKAQEALTKQFSEPFEIKFLQEDSAGYGKFEVKRYDPLRSIFSKLESVYPKIQTENIFLDKGYFLHDANVHTNNPAQLQEFAEANYFNFTPNPCFTGEVTLNVSPFEWIHEIIGRFPDESGELLATMDEFQRLDEVIRTTPSFQRENLLGAVFKVSPSESYLVAQRDKALNFLKHQLKISNITTSGYNQNIVIHNVFLNDLATDRLKKISAYHRSHHRIIFTINKEAFEVFDKNRKTRNIYYAFEDEKKNKKKGIILPNPEGNEFSLSFPGNISLSDLRYEIFRFKKIFERYFDRLDIQINHRQILRQDREIFAHVT